MDQDKRQHFVSRRQLLGATAAALTAGGVSPLAFAQTRAETILQAIPAQSTRPLQVRTQARICLQLPTEESSNPSCTLSTSLIAAYKTADGRARSRKPSFNPPRMWPASPCF